ncbi:HlyD family secretion protein [Schlesneria paludicola]|uniref:HlyD family secretion protein n=1 Tax=Schlesneria paludicola TaxID=360056 RepID=UPI00029AAA17|nr:HlyD family efflux transporter periplasmic adaptor subunit [Schlesneria paludicola]
MFKVCRNFFLPMLALGMFLFSLYHIMFAAEKLPKETPIVEPPRHSFTAGISGTGLVEARTENIALGTAVAGVVLEVCVTNDQLGQRVSAGTPLFRVDDRHLRAQLRTQQANLQLAEAQFQRLQQMPRPEDIPPSEAKVKVAEANRTRLKDQLDRGEQLFGKKIMADEEFTARRFTFLAADQQWQQAVAEDALLKAGAWQQDKNVSHASIETARASVANLETEIERCLVRAPVDGQILKIDVRPGEFVNASAAKALILLGDLDRLRVRVDLDERDISRFKSASRASATPRGATGNRLNLRFIRVEPYVIPKKAFTGENTERIDTRVLQVLYEIDDDISGVFVGQQLDVSIEYETK